MYPSPNSGSAIIPTASTSTCAPHSGSAVVGIQSVPLLFLCVTCGSGSPSVRALRDHLRNVHNIPHTEAHSAVETLSTKRSSLVSTVSLHPISSAYLQAPYPSSDNAPLALQEPVRLGPLAGIPVKQGYQCPMCESCYILPRGLRTHLLNDHALSSESTESKIQSVLVTGSIGLQSLYGGRKTRFFPVTENEEVGQVICKIEVNPKPRDPATTLTTNEDSHSSPPHSAPAQNHKGCLQAQPSPSFPSHQSPPRQAVLAFFKSLLHPQQDNPLSSAVESSRKSTFMLTTQFDKVLEDHRITLQQAAFLTAADESNRTPLLKSIKASIENYFSATGGLLRTMPPSFVHRINLRGNDGPFRLVSAATLDRYAVQVTRFVVYLIRSSTPSASPTLIALRRTSAETHASQTGISMDTIHKILKEELLHVMPDFHSVDNLNVRNFLAAASVIPYKTATPPDTESTCRPVEYRFADASDMTHTLAALQYMCSACAVHEMVKIRLAADTENNGNQNNGNQITSMVTGHVEHLLNSLCIDKHTSASFIRKSLDLCMGLSRLEEIDVNFDNCYVHSTCGIVKHVHIALPKLGEVVRATINAFNKTLHEEILFGHSLPAGFMTTSQSLTDNASARKPGLSFLTYNLRQVQWIQSNTLHVLEAIRNPAEEHLCRTPYAFPEAIVQQGSDSPAIVTVAHLPMWRTKVLRFLSHCQKLQEAVLSMVHVSSGSPARATEIATYRLHNDQYATRNIVLSQQDVTLIARYAKQRNIKGGARPIPRFPDRNTSKCILTYLTLVRPLECEMVRALYGEEPMRNHWYWMFADRGIPFSAKRIRNVVSSTLEAAGMAVSFGDYRHFVSGMVPVVGGSKLKAVIEEIEDEFSVTGHELASHSRQTADQVYARTSHQLSQVSSSEMARNRAWCHEWHRLLSLRTDEGQDYPLIPKNEPGDGPYSHITHDSPSHIHTEHQSPHPKRRKLSAPAATEPRSHDICLSRSSTAPAIGVGPCLHTSFPCSYEDVLPQLLAALRNTTGDQNAVFKSHTQFAVTASILVGHADKLVLMPTGSGKTMCILLPAAIEKGKGLSTIVVVPLVALQAEYEQRATLFGLDVSRHPSQSGSKEFSDVYIFTPEFLQKKEFDELVTRLSATNRLARIVVDEAHLTFLWASFRSALKNIRLSLALVPKHVPRVLLSATVPPEDRASLIAHHGLAQATLHSMPTLRRNLRFTVEYLSEETQPRTRDVSGTFSSPEDYMLQMTVINLHERLHRIATKSGDKIRNGNFCRVIIYAFTRSMCTSFYEALSRGFHTSSAASTEPFHLEALLYHAGLPEQQKLKMHEDWLYEERLDCSPETFPCFRVMVCTSAFGTGLDCRDIRLSIHMGAANGLVDLIQESGRAGRDGQTSECVVLYCPRYASFVEDTIRHRNDNNEIQNALRRWIQLKHWILNKSLCRKNWLYGFIDGSSPGICLFDPLTVNCDICDRLHGSPLYTFPSSNSNIQATPDTVRPWNTAASSGSSLQLSLPPGFQSSIGSFTDSGGLGTTQPNTTRPYPSVISLPKVKPGSSRNPSRATATPSLPSAPGGYPLNVSRRLQFTPPSSNPSPWRQQTHTPYINIRPEIASFPQAPPSFSNVQPNVQPLSVSQRIVAVVPPTQTPRTNGLLPQIQLEADPQIALHTVHNLARLGNDLCYPCLIHKSRHLKHDSSSCPWLIGRCFRCFSNAHRVSECTIPRTPQGYCFKCGLRNLLGQKLHTSDFSYGASCGIFPLVVMCWSLWRCESFQKTLATDFFPNHLLESYNNLLAPSNMAPRDSRFTSRLDNLFAQALSDGSEPFPTVIRIALSYASTAGFL